MERLFWKWQLLNIVKIIVSQISTESKKVKAIALAFQG